MTYVRRISPRSCAVRMRQRSVPSATLECTRPTSSPTNMSVLLSTRHRNRLSVTFARKTEGSSSAWRTERCSAVTVTCLSTPLIRSPAITSAFWCQERRWLWKRSKMMRSHSLQNGPRRCQARPLHLFRNHRIAVAHRCSLARLQFFEAPETPPAKLRILRLKQHARFHQCFRSLPAAHLRTQETFKVFRR